VPAPYLVGCDGGHSLIRKAVGIEFAGWDRSTSCLIADVEMTEEPSGVSDSRRCDNSVSNCWRQSM
jgi:2-polyprenyl-6-methoxyphenol hydroxylase-like FAD-dependent oxidoreductase